MEVMEDESSSNESGGSDYEPSSGESSGSDDHDGLQKCSKCLKSFTRNHKSPQQVTRHSGKTPLICDQCTVTVTEAGMQKKQTRSVILEEPKLKNQIREHSVEKPHQCDQCEKRFKLKGSLVRHLKSHSGEAAKTYKCKICHKGFIEKSFKHKESLVRHLKSHDAGEATKIYKCKICHKGLIEKSFKNKESLVRHLKSHAGEAAKIYKCKKCHKGFIEKSALNNHKETHAKEKKYLCGECGARFAQRKGLVHHMRIHVGIKPHKCTVCEKAFLFKAQLQSHMPVHTGEKPYKCDKCKKTFARKPDLKEHLQIHTERKLYDCLKCSADFKTKAYLAQHMKFVHWQQNALKQSHKCPECGKSFLRKFNLIKHMTVHTGEKPYICDHCQKSFSRKGGLKRHLKVHSQEKPYKCSKCAASFKYKLEQRFHMGAHMRPKCHLCDHCGKIYLKFNSLRHHIEFVHKKLNLYTCTECDKSYPCKSALVSHKMQVHGGKKPYTCDLCGKACAKRSKQLPIKAIHKDNELTVDMNCDKDKGYKCEDCGKKFIKKSDLKQHRKIHAKKSVYVCEECQPRIKSHKCGVCDKVFEFKHILELHMKLHTRLGKEYLCDICGLHLATPQSFNTHKNIHLGIQPFECSKCKKKFHDKKTLKYHNLEHVEKLFKCPTCLKSILSIYTLKIHMTLHSKNSKKKKFNSKSAIEKHIKWIQGGNKKKDECTINESQLSKLHDVYKNETREPDFTRILFLSKEIHLSRRQIKDYFKFQNDKQFLQPFGDVELQFGDNFIANKELYETAPQPLNGNGILVYMDKKKKVTAVRPIAPNEETVRYFQLYLTSWGPPGDIEKGIAVGYTNLYDVREAAKGIWQAVRYKEKGSCTYRFEYKERGWHSRYKTAIPLGIYSDNLGIIRQLKWWFRLFLQAMGTLHPHEVIEEYHHIATALEAVILPYYDILPIATRRWLDVSLLEMKMHLKDMDHLFPGINVSLTSDHEGWTQEHDYGKPGTKNSSHPK